MSSTATVFPLQRAPARWALLGAFAVIYLVWGSTFLGIRVAVETLPPFSMAAVRLVSTRARRATSTGMGCAGTSRPR